MSDSKGGLKPLPRLESDEEAERFVEEADLTEYDLSRFKPVPIEFERSTSEVRLRLPRDLLEAVKAKARAQGIPYQRFIRDTLEHALHDGRE